MSESIPLREAVVDEGAVLFRTDIGALEVASNIGEIIKDPVNGSKVDLISNSAESRNNPHHLSFGCAESELSFHTDYPNIDCPPRFVLLRCINEGRQSIATQYVSLANFTQSWLAGSLIGEPWLMQARDGRWKPCRVISFSAHGLIQVRFASNVMRAFFPRKSVLSTLARTAYEFFPVKEFILKRGDYLLLDNWSGLHRRTLALRNKANPQVEGTNDRILERVLIAS